MREKKLLDLAHVCQKGMEKNGVALVPDEDLRRFEINMSDLGKPGVHPMISSAWHDFSAGDAVGFQLRVNGVCAGGLAARFLDLGRGQLCDHLRSSYMRYYGKNSAEVVTDFNSATEFGGRVVYLGELFVVPECRGLISWGYVFHYIFTLCALRWNPDWIYSFMRDKDVGRGKDKQYGFWHCAPMPQRWLVDAPGRSESEYLVRISACEIEDASRIYTHAPDRLFSVDGLQTVKE